MTSQFTPSGPLAMHRARATQLDSAAPLSTPLFAESDEQRAQRLLGFVARQEPGLRWAVGVLADGSTLLVTDIAHGWIPPGSSCRRSSAAGARMADRNAHGDAGWPAGVVGCLQPGESSWSSE